MKALKLLLLTLFAALGLAAQAQTIEVYKDGQVIDTFSAAQVDSVVYKQVAAIPKYYYYVGTVKPTADSDIEAANMISEAPITTFIGVGDYSQYCWFACPKVWGTPEISDTEDFAKVYYADKSATITDGRLINYTIWRGAAKNFAGIRFYIRWKK